MGGGEYSLHISPKIMKKTLLLLSTAALLLAGCAKEKFAEPSVGGLTNATFTASVDGGVATKAVADNDGNGAFVNRCIMEIYFQNELYKRLVESTTSGVATFANVPVVAGKEYKILFWADHVDNADTPDGLAEDKYYDTDSQSGLKAVTVIKDAFIGELEEDGPTNDYLDAFFFAGDYTVPQAGGNYAATLKRPFAQLNVITTDVAEGKTVRSSDFLPEKVSVSYSAANTINVASGEISGTETYAYEALVYGVWSTVATSHELTLSMDYLLASTEQGAVDVAFKTKNGGNVVMSHNLTNLPYQRNYRTNVKGALLTVGGNWTATIDPIWNQPDIVKVVEVADIKSANEIIKEYAATTDNLEVKFVGVPNDSGEPSGEPESQFRAILTSPLKQDANLGIEVMTNTKTLYVGDYKVEYCVAELAAATELKAATVNINVPQNSGIETLVINAPTKTVLINGKLVDNVGTITNIDAITSQNTLIIEPGQQVTKLTMRQGGLEIHGTVGTLVIDQTDATNNPVKVRTSENLSQTVFDVIYKEGEHDYIDRPVYSEKKNADGTWNIVPSMEYPITIEYPEGVENGYSTIQEALTAAVDFGTQDPELVPEIHIWENILVSPTHSADNYGAIHMVDYGIQNIKGVVIDGTTLTLGKSKIVCSPAQASAYKASGIIKASSGAHVILKNIEFAFSGEAIDRAKYCIDVVDATVDLYNVKLVDGSYNNIQLNASTNSSTACYNFYEGEYSLGISIEGRTECFKTWGGTFNSDPSSFLPSSDYVTYKEGGKYKVCLTSEAPTYTASLTSNSKTTNYAGTSGPAAALNEAKSGDTVTLLSGTLNTGKNLGALGNTLTIVQDGGAYTGTVTTDATGCVVNAETEGNATVYTVVSDPDADKVAQVDDTKYSTVKDALTALNVDGKTVTLLRDVASFVPSYLAKYFNVTFDLNGKKICTTELFKNYNVSSKTVTITGDGIVESDVNGNSALISFYENGTPIYIFENGKYTVKNPLENNYVLSEKVSGTFNFNGGIFTGNVLAQYGTLNFSGAEFNGNLIIGAYDAKKTVNVNISGGIIDGNINIRPDSDGDYWKQATSTLNISGGVIEGVITKQDADNFVINISISGGKFKVKPDASYLAPGATCSDTPDSDGYYVVTSNN